MKAYKLFTEQEAREIREQIPAWAQAHAQERAGKHNEEATSEALETRIVERLNTGPIPAMHFIDGISPIKFNCYRDGGEYGSHSDASQMHGVRTDLACTLFLSDGYEGGELCVAGHEVKLPPGHCVVYECWRPHQVKPVASGERIAAIWWMSSYIRSEEQRDLLGMLRGVIAETTNADHFAKLGAVHEKLVKQWWS